MLDNSKELGRHKYQGINKSRTHMNLKQSSQLTNQ